MPFLEHQKYGYMDYTFDSVIPRTLVFTPKCMHKIWLLSGESCRFTADRTEAGSLDGQMRKIFRDGKKHRSTSPGSKPIVCRTREHRQCEHSLDITMQQTTLPHRVVRSAKDLASATLSGTTFELKTPWGNKHSGASAQASSSLQHLPTDSAQSRASIDLRGSAFRNGTVATLHKAAEENFQTFQELADLQAEYNACLATLQDIDAPPEASCDSSLTETDLASKAVVQRADVVMIDTDDSASRHEWSSESTQDNNVDLARTAAAQRLNQIAAHLQRSLAMQTPQQDAFDQSHLLVHKTRSLFLDEHTRQADDVNRNTLRRDQAGLHYPGVHGNLAPQHRDTVAHLAHPPSLSTEKEENVLHRQFHCPYYACHHNLQLLLASNSSSSQRQCVHAGCGLNIETFTAWAEHIHTAHHDLLGSL